MRAGRRQRVTAAWTVRCQPYPAVGTELPVWFKLAAAIATLFEELVKFFTALEERRCHLALLGLLFLVVHCGPFVASYAWRAVANRLPERQPRSAHLMVDS